MATSQAKQFGPSRPFSERAGVLLTFDEASDYLGVNVRQVIRMASDRRLVVTKVGKHRRVHIDDLNALIAQGRNHSSDRIG